MAKIPFDVKFRPQIESGEYKVETNDYHSVRIICWNKNTGGLDRIVALVAGDSGQEKTLHYTEEGWCVSSGGNKNKNLFLITPEPELSEFENKLRVICEDAVRESQLFPERTSEDFAKKHSAELLALARKELEPEVLERLDAAYKNQDEVVYENGKRDGKAEALKNLPRWRKCGKETLRTYGDEHFEYRHSGAYIVTKKHEILLSDLEKLPGFKE